MGILQNEGFYDIHFIHGNYEFGKDFIAKKDDYDGQVIQYAFQSKAGDVDTGDWRAIREQIEDIVFGGLAHPNYDSDAPLQVGLVITGRLIGASSLSAQAFDEYCKSRGCLGFNVWDSNKLIEAITRTGPAEAGLAANTAGFQLILGIIRTNKCTFSELEKYSLNWVEKESVKDTKKHIRSVLEASIIIHELMRLDKLTLACYVPLFCLRAVLLSAINIEKLSEQLNNIVKLIENMFDWSVNYMIGVVHDEYLDNKGQIDIMRTKLNFITYPVFCLQIMELWSLWVILQVVENKQLPALSITLEEFLQGNAACYRPISDRYAVSMIFPFIYFAGQGKNEICIKLLRETTKWLCDRYEDSEFGLAKCYSSEYDEIRILLGYCFSFEDIPKRKSSYIATVLLDLAAVFGQGILYEDMINDFLAVGIIPCLILPKVPESEYLIAEESLTFNRVPFNERWEPNLTWQMSPHHSLQHSNCFQKDLWWEALAMSAVLRDRHNVTDIREIIKGLFQNINK